MEPKACPACGREVAGDALECPSCGVIFSKWRGRSRPSPLPPSPPPARPPTSSPPPAPRPKPFSPRALLLLVVGVVLIVVVARWPGRGPAPTGGGSGAAPIPEGTLRLAEDRASDFDRSGKLPAGPIGLVWTGDALLAGSRDDPWGFLRLTPAGAGAFRVVTVPVIEPVYRQTMSFNAVTWNGREVVAATSAAWFQEDEGMVFTVHDPVTLAVERHQPAPPLIGCLAWDGRQYWAATRRNTRDSGEPAYLYRLSRDFRVLGRSEPPGVGCQGLAWDGELLWFADVFDESLTLLDPSSTPPRVVKRYETRFDYLSGIAFDGESTWVAEYGQDRLLRLNPRLAQAWRSSGGFPEVTLAAGTSERQPEAPAERAPAAEAPEADVAELRRKLRSDDWGERMGAEMELGRLGVPIDYARSQNQFPEPRTPETLDVLDWAVELEEGSLYGSWHLVFGEALISSAREGRAGPVTLPLFARYTVTVEGGTLSSPIERQFDAESGDNRRSHVELASGLGRGTYQVSLFLHVQYIKPDGEAQILNQSATTLEVGQ